MTGHTSTGDGLPTRVSFNFLDRCNLACRFCYLPFDGRASAYDTWLDVVGRLVELGAESITFGGGDPFRYRRFPELLGHVRAELPQITFVQVDTNALGWAERSLADIAATVDLVGLPVDGSTDAVHTRMRDRAGHLDRVLHVVERLQGQVPIKINTVVSRVNAGDLVQLGRLLSRYRIAIWSLYEFWPVGPIAVRNKPGFQLGADEFAAAVDRVVSSCPDLPVEVNAAAARSKSYFFTSQTGRAYAVDGADPNAYVELGSVHDEDIVRKWLDHADPTSNAHRVRERRRRSTPC
ncbi:radical SAM family protein [Saccharothrix saharensis]|uniref:Radical SAM family protein n=1 Tax=Saccharothrix saharensis TaxID=571190 RepID=A0A543JIZ4_9PSEU|nr:radical SAM protein [Saccharothrix saharensis]TQM82827.1 radical SAM family protein [Saccharothrix saharensis]